MKNRILVCDDDKGILEMLTLLFRYSGFEIATQLHSLKIFEDIDAFKPDLLIVDLWMPGLNGEEIIRRIKNSAGHKNLPVILASAGQDGQRIADEIQADKFIAKPFDVEKLLDTTESLIRMYGQKTSS